MLNVPAPIGRLPDQIPVELLLRTDVEAGVDATNVLETTDADRLSGSESVALSMKKWILPGFFPKAATVETPTRTRVEWHVDSFPHHSDCEVFVLVSAFD